MKNLIALLFILPLFAFVNKETAFTADTKASNVHWLGKKTTGQHEGDVKVKSGTLNFNGSTPVNGEFVLDMTSVTVTDIADTEDNKHLVDHLANDDFFSIAKNPTAVLSIKKLEKMAAAKAGEANYQLTADLTIKGIKNEIQFPAIINVNGKKATAKADFTIDRTKWNITYKSKSILGGMADKFIYDEIYFSVNLSLNN